MELTFLGGALEVGKSCVHASINGVDAVFDSGLKLTEPPTNHLPADNVDVAFLSHAHLDHCGNLPQLHSQHTMPIYATPVSFELSHMLQQDSIKIDKLKGNPLKYTPRDIERMIVGEINILQGKTYKFHNKIDFTFYDAGHIPGSSGILVRGKNKSVFYTGDTHDSDTRLLNKAEYPKQADVVISESTYGARDHPPRKEVEKEFLDEVESTIERGGTALIPVFAIGRTQEVLLLLDELDYDIYLDGMARRASQTILKYPDMLKSPDKLYDAVNKCVWVKNRSQRKKIVQKPSVIVTTAGMLEGGPVLDYLNRLHADSNSSILLTGYQVEETNGRTLMEKGIVVDEEADRKYRVDMNIRQFDFSAHTGKPGLVKTITDMNPEEIILMHGDPTAIGELKDEFGGQSVHTPELGQKLVFDD